MNTILILIVLYIVQLLILFSIPYIFYRQDTYAVERTVGGFLDYMAGYMSTYVFLALFPFLGFALIAIGMGAGVINILFRKIGTFIYKHIKDIKI